MVPPLNKDGRCADRIAEGGDCRDGRRNRCADGLVCLNVDDASAVFGGTTTNSQVSVTVDENWGEDWGSGVIVRVFEPGVDNAEAFVSCSIDELNVTFGAVDAVLTNNTAAGVVALINASECSDKFDVDKVGTTGAELVPAANPAAVLEGAYECVKPPLKVGDKCAFGARGEFGCGMYADFRATCGETSGVCEAPGKVGDICSDESDCEDGLACNQTTNKCVAKGGDGADCKYDTGGDSDLCLNELVGDACTDEEVEEIWRGCYPVGGGDYKCYESDNLPNGAPCGGDDDCNSKFCQNLGIGGTAPAPVCAARLADDATCNRGKIPTSENGFDGSPFPEVSTTRTEACGLDSYCKYAIDSAEGKCTPKGGTAAPCSPHFGLQYNGNLDCLSGTCTLLHDEYICSPNEDLLCGEYFDDPTPVPDE
jgi:hypothetical protein